MLLQYFNTQGIPYLLSQHQWQLFALIYSAFLLESLDHDLCPSGKNLNTPNYVINYLCWVLTCQNRHNCSIFYQWVSNLYKMMIGVIGFSLLPPNSKVWSLLSFKSRKGSKFIRIFTAYMIDKFDKTSYCSIVRPCLQILKTKLSCIV